MTPSTLPSTIGSSTSYVKAERLVLDDAASTARSHSRTPRRLTVDHLVDHASRFANRIASKITNINAMERKQLADTWLNEYARVKKFWKSQGRLF